MRTDTYWNNAGKHQEQATKLNELVPTQGSVKHPKKNKALEKFRKAQNCYYDLYNNGLCNRKAEFRRVFNILSSQYIYAGGRFIDEVLYDKVELLMDDIIEAAAEEQAI